MQKSKKKQDALPQSFKTINKFTEFWDSHSTADYPEAFSEVKSKVTIHRRRYYRVALKSQIARRLTERAHAQGVTLDTLVNRMLEKHLQ